MGAFAPQRAIYQRMLASQARYGSGPVDTGVALVIP
jgi:hypothetical protein